MMTHMMMVLSFRIRSRVNGETAKRSTDDEEEEKKKRLFRGGAVGE